MNKKYLIIPMVCLCLGNTLVKANQPNEKIDSIALQEVVVQGSREQTKLMKTPNSVTLINAKQIASLGMNSLTDATSAVANLFMPDYGSKLTSPIYIRGIGSRINSPSVGLYVDHVPYFEKASFNFDFFDISRIEVLRGPQGTEYGRNTMGGIINIITKSPLDYQGLDVNLQAGTYGSYLTNLGYYSKVNDKFAYSLSVNYRHNDGFYTNKYLNEKVDLLNSYSFRNKLIWMVNKKLSVENILSYEKSLQGGYPYALYNVTSNSVSPINYNQKSGYNRDIVSDALLFKYKARTFDLIATTSYQYLNDKQYIDQDFSSDSLYFVTQREKQNMISQELIVQSKKTYRYNWLFGAYGFVQQFNNNNDVNTYKAKTETWKYYDHTISGGALFHQSTLKNFPINNMDITGGIRFDRESDHMAYKYDRRAAGRISNINDTTYKPLNSVQVLPKLSISYSLENSNIYALISKGYKTGGFNSTFERPEDLTFEPEYSWNYEIGTKMAFLHKKLFATVSLFYIDWKNQQIYQTTPSGTGSMLKNAGKSYSKGLELGINAGEFTGFELSANYGFTYAKFTEYTLNQSTNYNGHFIPYVPRNTVSTQIRKTFGIQNSKFLDKIILSALYKGTGDIYWDEKNAHKQSYYSLLDGRISFVIKNNLQFDIWADNLGSTEYQAFYFEALGKSFVQMGKPLQAGVKLSMKF